MILTPTHHRYLLAAAMTVLQAQQSLQQDGKTVLHYLQHGLEEEGFEAWAHYPRGDRIDAKTGGQYYYHCHRENFETEEHGHLHTFVRYAHVPKSCQPLPLAYADSTMDNPMTHLVAIGLSRYGQPIRLFTVNRWVTDEVWYPAATAEKLLARFQVQRGGSEYWAVLDTWVTGLMRLFQPQIAVLLQQRDAAVAAWQAAHPEELPYDCRELEELSSLDISLEKQVLWLQGGEAPSIHAA